MGARRALTAEVLKPASNPPQAKMSVYVINLRKLNLLLRARALFAFPGSYCTVDELFEILTLVCESARRLTPNRLPTLTPLVGYEGIANAMKIDGRLES